jgi:hypothetical protein
MSGRRSSLAQAIEHASSITTAPATTWWETVRSSAAALAAKYAAISSWRLHMTTAPALRQVVADAHDRGGLVALDALVDVIGDSAYSSRSQLTPRSMTNARPGPSAGQSLATTIPPTRTA